MAKRPPPRLYRQAGLPPAAGHRRRHRACRSRLGEGRANIARGAAHSCGRRWDGCATPGPRDDSRYGPTAASTLMAWYPSAQDGCPLLHHGIRQRRAWPPRRYPSMPPHSLLDGRRRRCGRDHLHSLPGEPEPRRCGSSSGVEAHARFPAGRSSANTAIRFITDREWRCSNWRPTIAGHAEIQNAIRDLKHGVGLNHRPSGASPPTAPGWPSRRWPTTLARWTARIGLGERIATTKTLRRGSSPWPDGSPARHAG